MKTPIVLLALLACGCATTVERAWVTDAQLAYEPERYPDDAAVILYRGDKTTLEVNGSASTSRVERHEVIAVRGENGFWLAEVKVPYRAQDTLAGFRARLVQPDGTRKEFDAKSFLSDVSGKGERTLNAHYFRFPEVKVGSILEYWWVIESDGLYRADEQETLGSYPVKLYEFELAAAKPLVVETIEWNGAAPIQQQEWSNGEHHLRFSLTDLPRREPEDFAPHFSFVEPRWAWRVLAWRDRGVSYDWLRDWKDVVERNGRRFYFEPELFKGFSLSIDPAGCNDVPCLVSRGFNAIVDRTVDWNIAWGRAENLQSALTSGAASITERAVMLRSMLERAGVEAWLAYGTDALAQQLSPGFPRFEQFDHLFVYLPRQKGLDLPMTIDPDCDFCTPGQLTARHRGQPIYVFKTQPVLSSSLTEGRWDTANGPAAPASEKRFTHAATIQADGSIDDTISTESLGLDAERWSEDFKHRNDKLRQREVDEWARSSGLAEVKTSTWGECEHRKARCQWKSDARFPAQAWKSGDGWAVHLGFLNAAFSDLFDPERRTADVHFTWDDFSLVEVLELTAPPNTRLVLMPPPVNVNAGSLRASVKVERTPTGARVTRRLDRSIGVEPKSKYDDLRAAADAFKRARQLVLTFAPETK
ncbi:MAG: DUF3857 domain-containing protein [Myxococcaceae bacterium]